MEFGCPFIMQATASRAGQLRLTGDSPLPQVGEEGTMKAKLVIKIDQTKVARGHRQPVSGGGKHADRRLKRQKTRSQQKRAAMSGW